MQRGVVLPFFTKKLLSLKRKLGSFPRGNRLNSIPENIQFHSQDILSTPISSLGSYLRVTYVSSGMMNEWKSNFGAVGGWTNVCIPCLIRLLNA